MMIKICTVVVVTMVYQILLPLSLGSIRKGRSFGGRYLDGYLIQWAVFYLVAQFTIRRHGDLQQLQWTWMILGGILIALVGIWKRKDILSGFRNEIWKTISWKRAAVLPVILMVTFLVQILVKPLWSDSTVAMALTAHNTNTLFVYDCYTGVVLEELPEIAASPLPIYYAVFSGLFQIPPATVIKYLFSFLMLVMAYLSYWELGERIFVSGKAQRVWMICLIGIYLSFLFADTRVETQLLRVPWNGQAIFCGCIIPAFVTRFLWVLQERKKRRLSGTEWGQMIVWSLIFCLASQLLCMYGCLMILILIVAGALIFLARRYQYHG